MSAVPTLQQANFGVGYLYAVASTSNPTPVQIATLQEISPDFSADVKELYGQNSFPEIIAAGKRKATMKAKSGRIYGQTLSQLVLPGATTGSGVVLLSANEAGTVPTTPYQVTVSNSSNWQTDLGVVFTSGANAGKQLTRVASSPTAGQYSVASGVYTFAAADTTLGVAISYTYTSTGGTTVSYTNQLMGNGNTFQLIVGNYFNGNFQGIKFYAAICDKLSFPMKNDDFTLYDLEFKLFVDSTGKFCDIYTLE